ncbi:MAG TPA: RDD family protein [Bacillota bacterium]
MNEVYKVITPENVELDYEVAGIGSRFLAIVIDTLIQWVLIIGILSSLGMLKLGELRSKITHWSTSFAGSLLIGLLFLVLIGYFIILETVMNGQTVGKKLVNIRVRKEGGYAPSFWDVLLRNVIRMVDYLPFFYGFGMITMFFNQKAKRLGDYAAGTIVVKELPRRKVKKFLDEQAAQTVVSPGESTAVIERYPWLPGIVPSITQADYLIMKNLYSRQKELTTGRSLAKTLIQKVVSASIKAEDLSINESDIMEVLAEMIVLYENQQF